MSKAPRLPKEKPWNRCDDCGRFIALDDFGNGARRVMVLPDSDFTSETYETLCVGCNKRGRV